jgi:glycosyltransferase involved in cell wall biosynthesis
MLVRREVFRDSGLLDDRFFMYFEDAEFCLRARRAGWHTGVVVSALMEETPGAGQRPGAYRYLATRNGLEFARTARGWRGLAGGLRRCVDENQGTLRALLSPRSDAGTRAAAGRQLAPVVRGVADFMRRRWGAPPTDLPDVGDAAVAPVGERERCVVVSRFSPWHDGIAKYADQLAEKRRLEGPVLRLGLPGSEADQVVRLDGGLRPLRMLRATRRDDTVLLMWHPWYYVSGRAWDRAAAYLALGMVLRSRRVRVVVHEPDWPSEPGRGIRRAVRAVERAAQWWCWTSPAELVFHSQWQREDFARRLPETASHRQVSFIDHAGVYRPYVEADRVEARQRLGLPQVDPLFLSIGFFGRHKGFDRAITAFLHLPQGAARLYVIGSTPYEWPDTASYVAELRRLAEGRDDVAIIERYLDDVDFDLWIRAADAVVLPYRIGSSSAVAARARVLGTRCVVTRVGGRPEQSGPEDIVVDSDEELAAAVVHIAGRSPLPEAVGY